MKKPSPHLEIPNLATEQPNPASADLDLKSSLDIARIINSEDAKVARAVEQALFLIFGSEYRNVPSFIAEKITIGGVDISGQRLLALTAFVEQIER